MADTNSVRLAKFVAKPLGRTAGALWGITCAVASGSGEFAETLIDTLPEEFEKGQNATERWLAVKAERAAAKAARVAAAAQAAAVQQPATMQAV